MLINVRDDDTNYFTKPDELIRAYGDYLGTIPITLACTPFVSSHSFIMDALDGDRTRQYEKLKSIEERMSASCIAEMNRLYPLGENKNLTELLRSLVKKEKLEIGLHGYSHRFYPDGAEFEGNHVNLFNVRDGKRYLEELLACEVDFFIPPSNKIDVRGLSFLRRSNVKLLTSGVVDCSSILEYFLIYGLYVLRNPLSLGEFVQGKLPVSVARFNGVDYLRSCTFKLEDDYDSFMSRYRKKMLSDGFLSIATHYTTLSSNYDYRDRFFDLIERLRSEKKCEFVTARELHQRIA